MARDILSEYGPESASDAPAPALSASQGRSQRDVNNYQRPQGPSNIGDSKSPGLHGNNYGSCGTQGEYDITCETSGSPGLHGNNRGMGTNRKG